MSVFHLDYEAIEEQPGGVKIEVPPPVVLARSGPVIQVTVSLLPIIAEQVVQAGGLVHPPAVGLALIDTGASHTCVDEAIAQLLHLPVVDVAHITSASHELTQVNVYPVQIQIIGSPMNVGIKKAPGCSLQSQGLIALIGRDLLQHCTLFYNGAVGQITLSL